MAFVDLVDLAQERLGGRALYASDDFFAPKENLLKPGRGEFIADKYTDRGKWMDGWESRRKRTPGNDFCIVRLGLPGIIRGVDIDTNHFLGNFPESASLEGCIAEATAEGAALAQDEKIWQPLLIRSVLQGGAQNLFPINDQRRFTHVRLSIFPDGGVARLRVYGEVLPDWPQLLAKSKLLNAIAVEHGGQVIGASNMFFSHPHHLLLPDAPLNMGDGWETKRRRGPGHDWVIIKLGRPTAPTVVEVGTHFFKGNYPDRCSLEGASMAEGSDPLAFAEWRTLLEETKLGPDQSARLKLHSGPAVTHIRFNIFPDGGVSRLKLFGDVALA